MGGPIRVVIDIWHVAVGNSMFSEVKWVLKIAF
jgi:hypothetical protein